MHVFAVFSGNVARGPIGLESPLAAASHRNTSYFAVDQDELEHTLEVLFPPPAAEPAMSIAPACDSAPCSPTQRARRSAARCLSHRCRKRPLQRAGEPELTKLLHERLIMALQNPAAR